MRANQLHTVESVRVSHGSYRPIAFSASITETTTYEYDPHLPSRTVYEDGEFKQVPPFARPREIELPAPYGKTTQYIIPHSETITLAKALENKGVKLIETKELGQSKICSSYVHCMITVYCVMIKLK